MRFSSGEVTKTGRAGHSPVAMIPSPSSEPRATLPGLAPAASLSEPPRPTFEAGAAPGEWVAVARLRGAITKGGDGGHSPGETQHCLGRLS